MGMGGTAFRGMVSCVLSVLFPFAMFAADSNAAMLYSNGPIWVNGAHIPRPALAIFAGDLLQTRSDSVANINEPGSMITVLSETLVQFGGSSVKIEHGGVMVSTSRQLSTTAGDVKVSPVSTSWTEFNVVDVDGIVRIAARKGDLTISDGKQVTTLAQGQETTRDENSDDAGNGGKKKKGIVVPVGANRGLLNSPLAIGLAGGAVLGMAIWVFHFDDDPASPYRP
jgi:hypothetical protein